jgi:hypothetical protein
MLESVVLATISDFDMLTLQMMQPLPNYLQPNVVTFSVIINCTIFTQFEIGKACKHGQ